MQAHRVVCTELFEEPAVGAVYISNYRIIFQGNLISVSPLGVGKEGVVVMTGFRRVGATYLCSLRLKANLGVGGWEGTSPLPNSFVINVVLFFKLEVKGSEISGWEGVANF